MTTTEDQTFTDVWVETNIGNYPQFDHMEIVRGGSNATWPHGNSYPFTRDGVMQAAWQFWITSEQDHRNRWNGFVFFVKENQAALGIQANFGNPHGWVFVS